MTSQQRNEVIDSLVKSVATYSSFRSEAERCDFTMSTVHCIT